ncbi:FAD synthase-like [Chelonus insularis]|uniref:FAD synthase-like n=1 Tax=Chelonus insularis TaxID=460826 RepID=UPI00158C5CCD|nr:FAD synthase-like [Chelonus insularis]XP_034940947.1 FAD synthase-like [Chelonus insularis]XP_034940948.1 FAD synthase-like [Chelonus insularis]
MLRIFQYVLQNFSLNTLRNYAGIANKTLSTLSGNYTAGLIIIGDEILKAQVKDTNSHFMCSLLYECGVKVEKISVISDNVDIIANEIKEFSERYKYVITSGGVGPTHDDMTYEGLAKAFSDSLHYHPTLVSIVKELCKTDDKNSPLYKVANIPSSAVLKFGKNDKTGEVLKFPCVNVKNVYVFPGSPIYLEPLFYSLCKELFNTHKIFFKQVLYIDATEELFANALTSVAKDFPNVAFGSYPVSNQKYYKVRVTVESDNEDVTNGALNKFCSLIPAEIVIDYDDSPEIDSLAKYNKFISNLERKSDTTVFQNLLDELCDIYKEPNKVALCIDGSIGSMILLHLAHIAQKKINNDSDYYGIFFKEKKNTEQFIEGVSKRYNLKLITLDITTVENLESLKISLPQLQILLMHNNSLSEKQDEFFHMLTRKAQLSSIIIKSPLMVLTSDSLWTFAKSFSLPYSSL